MDVPTGRMTWANSTTHTDDMTCWVAEVRSSGPMAPVHRILWMAFNDASCVITDAESRELIYLETHLICAFREAGEVMVSSTSSDEVILLPPDIGEETQAMRSRFAFASWADAEIKGVPPSFDDPGALLSTRSGDFVSLTVDRESGMVAKAIFLGPDKISVKWTLETLYIRKDLVDHRWFAPDSY